MTGTETEGTASENDRAQERADIAARLADSVDWQAAARVGRRLAPAPPKMTPYTERRLYAELARAAIDAEGPVREVTGLQDDGRIPPARVVDRPEWIEAAALSMRNMIVREEPATDGDATDGNAADGEATDGVVAAVPTTEPAESDRTGAAASLKSAVGALADQVGGIAAGAPTGAMLAYLSSAILGQYDPFTGPDGTLVLVAPNVLSVERTLRVRPSDFRMWVCLHEVTHRVQFTSAPWLRDYMRDSVDVLLEPSDIPIGRLVERLAAAVRADRNGDADGVMDGGVVGLMRAIRDPEQRDALDRMMALGTLLEGHADHVMDAVGPMVVPTVVDIRSAFDNRRRAQRSPVQRVIRALLGLDAKMSQYLRGKAFVDAVVDRVGMEQFNAVWTDASTLPKWDEIEAPERWVARVLG